MERNRGKLLFFTGIGTAAILLAMVVITQVSEYGTEDKTQIAKEEQGKQDVDVQESEFASAEDRIGAEYEDYVTSDKQEEDVAQAAQETEAMDGAKTTEHTQTAEKELEVEVAVAAEEEAQNVFAEQQLHFTEDTTIEWPVKGDVIMNYSMDKTIYFATLDQYKYNPAIIIQAKVNTKVYAGVRGTIAEISTNETTGQTIVVDLGDGYQAVYGQLKEVKGKVGDAVTADTLLGYVAEPTKYYSVEGANLYFAMTKDETPINPLEYLA